MNVMARVIWQQYKYERWRYQYACRRNSLTIKRHTFSSHTFTFMMLCILIFFPVGYIPLCFTFCCHMCLCLVKTLYARYFYLYTFCKLEQNFSKIKKVPGAPSLWDGLRELGLFSLVKRRLWRHLTAPSST